MQHLFLCVAIFLSALAPAVAQQKLKSYSPKVGEVHPDFVLSNIETEQPVWLSDYRGKKVLLIHFASW